MCLETFNASFKSVRREALLCCYFCLTFSSELGFALQWVKHWPVCLDRLYTFFYRKQSSRTVWRNDISAIFIRIKCRFILGPCDLTKWNVTIMARSSALAKLLNPILASFNGLCWIKQCLISFEVTLAILVVFQFIKPMIPLFATLWLKNVAAVIILHHHRRHLDR